MSFYTYVEDAWTPDEDWGLRLTPTTEARVRYDETPLAPFDRWIPDRLCLTYRTGRSGP